MLPVTAQNTQYLTFIANVDYQFHPKWNVYVKGAYETAGVYEANGVFAKGRYITSWNAQACVEWFPFTEDKGFKVFAHYLYKGHHLTQNADALMAVMPHTQRASLGIVYVIPVL
jgi:predicted porin